MGMMIVLLKSIKAQEQQSDIKERGDQGYIILGKIEGIDSGSASLYNPHATTNKLAYSKIRNGAFKFTGLADTPQLFFLGIQSKNHKDFIRGFYAENTHIKISFDINSPENIVITGSATEIEFEKFLKGFKPYSDEENRLEKLYDSLEAKKKWTGRDSVRRLKDSYWLRAREYISNYASQNPSSFIAANYVYYYFKDNPSADEVEEIYKKFSSSVQNCYYGKKIKDIFMVARNISVGSSAPDFLQNDISGEPVSLVSFRGRYLLVEFWASWCLPCRVDNPQIAEVYSKFHPKGLDMISVSLDTKKPAWEEAIKKDKLVWTQVSDLQGWDNPVRALYGVEYIPMNFLIDQEGKIIARALFGEDLEKKLSEILK